MTVKEQFVNRFIGNDKTINLLSSMLVGTGTMFIVSILTDDKRTAKEYITIGALVFLTSFVLISSANDSNEKTK